MFLFEINQDLEKKKEKEKKRKNWYIQTIGNIVNFSSS